MDNINNIDMYVYIYIYINIKKIPNLSVQSVGLSKPLALFIPVSLRAHDTHKHKTYKYTKHISTHAKFCPSTFPSLFLFITKYAIQIVVR